ncbi:hypothetical protein F2Q69_00018351 [Brassica cretica]|uniref:Uncharacterized protein n=1 Tax=Brassica cretica TaxID=69181 RepID=A0A8S9Q601_BRACR|nr:hypothetical protein F2Q69_00018351 [Brassica cretica]
MPLPPCFIYYVLRRVAAGSGVLNRSLWASTASPEPGSDLSRSARRNGVASLPSPFWSVRCFHCHPLSPHPAALVRTSLTCFKLKRRYRGLSLGTSSCSLHVSHLLIGVSCSSAFKLQKEDCYCPLPLLMLCDWIPLCSASVIATSGVNFTSSDGRTRTCRPCFACPSVGVALGMVCGPSDRSHVVFSYEQCDFEAGLGFKRNTLVSC